MCVCAFMSVSSPLKLNCTFIYSGVCTNWHILYSVWSFSSRVALCQQVEELKSQLKVAHQEEQQALLAKMEAERTSEVMGLKAQYEAELNCIKEELSRVQREGDAARSSAEQRLASETAQKQVRQSRRQWWKNVPSFTQRAFQSSISFYGEKCFSFVL